MQVFSADLNIDGGVTLSVQSDIHGLIKLLGKFNLAKLTANVTESTVGDIVQGQLQGHREKDVRDHIINEKNLSYCKLQV